MSIMNKQKKKKSWITCQNRVVIQLTSHTITHNSCSVCKMTAPDPQQVLQ